MQRAGFVQTEQTFLKCLQACTTLNSSSSKSNTTTTTDTVLLVEVWNALIQTVEPTFVHVEYVLQHTNKNPEIIDLLRQSSKTHQWALQILCQRGQWKWAIREYKLLQQQPKDEESLHSNTTSTATNSTTTITITPETYRALWKVCLHANDCPMEALLSILQAASHILMATDIHDILQAVTTPQRSWRNVMTLFQFMQQHHASKLSLPCYHAILFHRHLPCAQALFLLRDLQKKETLPTIETYNRVMYLAQRERNVPLVLQLLQELQQKYNLQPNVVTYTHVVRACLMDKQWKRALVVFQVAQDKLPAVDVYLYTAAMEACVALKQTTRALELLDEMQQQDNIRPNSFTYRVAMQAAPQRALEFLNALKASSSSGESIPLITYNAALQALAQTAKQQAKDQSVAAVNATNTTAGTPIWQHAVDLLEEIKQQKLQPDGFTYNAVIMCCCHGPWELALQYIQEMQDSSEPPNRLVYTAAIVSCGKHGQADHALRLLAQMKQYKIQPDLVTYNAVFTALRVAHKAEQALQLWNELLEQGAAMPATLLVSRTVVGDVPKRRYSTGKTTLVPDIITITEVIGALAGVNESNEYQTHVDDIVAYSVKRKLLLNGFLDSLNEINLSGLTFPVARAASRYLLQNYQHVDGQDLTLITGVGKQSNKTSLRDYLQEWLEEEFGLQTSIPRLAQGTLVVSSDSLQRRASQ